MQNRDIMLERDSQLWDFVDKMEGKKITVQTAEDIGRRVRRAGLYLDEVGEIFSDYGFRFKDHGEFGWKEEDRILSPSHRFYPMT